MDKNLVLIGYMGTYKSTVGKKLSSLLGMTFFDSDDLIIHKAGKSIPDIFGQDGEETFRHLEKEAILYLSEQRNIIIATGGGAPTRLHNMQALIKNGSIVWLDASPEAVFNRVSNDSNRPLAPKKIEIIGEMMLARRSYYERFANLKCDTSDLTSDEVAEKIAKWWERVNNKDNHML